MAAAHHTASLQRPLRYGALATTQRATKWERAVASRRFWRSDIFLGACTCRHRGMFYSLLVHAALLPVLLTLNFPVPRSKAPLDAYLMPVDTPVSVPTALTAAISRPMQTPPICCAPQTIVSHPDRATNPMQTILQPDLPNPPSLENFIPLPNLLALRRVFGRSGLHLSASIALEPPAMPEASRPREEPDANRLLRGDALADGAEGVRDTLALSVLPAPPDETVSPPAAESRGRFAETSVSNVAAEPAAGEPETRSTPAKRAETVFPGITIQGGEWKADSRPAEPTPAAPRREEPRPSSYALTIASSGNSGGGLRDFGIFGNEAVFTQYFDVSASGGAPAPPWILQYAFIPACCGLREAVVPPLPLKEVPPGWPQDLAAAHGGEMIVVRAVIAADGTVGEIRVLKSPSSGLNGAILDSLAQWVFQPAQRNGQFSAIKALFGIPVANDR